MVRKIEFNRGTYELHFLCSLVITETLEDQTGLETDSNRSTFRRGHTEQVSCYSTVVWKDCEEIGPVMKRK